MVNEKNKFIKLSNWLVHNSITAIILFCFLSFVIVSILYIYNHPEYLIPIELLYFIPVVILFVIEIIVVIKSLKIKHFLVLWSLVFVIKSIIIIFCLNSPPQGDGGEIFNEALYLSQGGEFPLDLSNGFYECNWLMWTVYVEKIIICFWNVGYEFFKVIGTVCLLGSGLIIYRIVGNIVSERITKIVFGLYVLFAPISLCVSHFSHQHVAFFLLMLSIYFITSESLYKWASAGLTCGLMNGFRPWGILIILTAGVYLVYCVFSKKNRIFHRILLFALFLVIYKLTEFLIDHILISSGYYDPQALNGSVLWIKIDRGIDPDMESFAKHVNKIILAKSGTNRELISMKNELYYSRVLELLKTATPYSYVVNKMIRMFGEVDYWFENCFANKLSVLEYPTRILYFFNWFQYVIAVVLAFIGSFRNKNDKVVNTLSIFTIGYFLAHFFIEAFSSYRLCVYPLILMYAAVGIDRVLKWYKNENFVCFKRILNSNDNV